MQSVKEGNCRFGADLTQVSQTLVVSHRQLFLSQDAVVTTLGTFQLIKGVVDPMKDQVSEAILKIKLSPLDPFS